MERGGGTGGASPERQQVVYCVIPRELARKLHEPLRRHFRDDASVEVVVEHRLAERRTLSERRDDGARPAGRAADRRSIRAKTGRRVADRRAPVLDVPTPALPRGLGRYAHRIGFVERLVPSSQEAEDVDTARILTRVQAGDVSAFADIYLRYFDRVYGYLVVVLNDPHRAEDAAQQVFVKALEALPRYERRTQPWRAWVFTIARNEALDELRRQNRFELSEPDQLDRLRDEDEADLEPLESLDWISDRELVLFVERLPLAQRQALMLRFTGDLSNAQIAEILGRSTADVRMLQSRALRFLRARLVAVGRGPTERRGRTRMRRWPREAPVLRARRWALHL
jgi:RNA polymerase sigma-70 factor (ECF subfamily)